MTVWRLAFENFLLPTFQTICCSVLSCISLILKVLFNIGSLFHAIKFNDVAHLPDTLSPLCRFEHHQLDRYAYSNIGWLYFQTILTWEIRKEMEIKGVEKLFPRYKGKCFSITCWCLESQLRILRNLSCVLIGGDSHCVSHSTVEAPCQASAGVKGTDEYWKEKAKNNVGDGAVLNADRTTQRSWNQHLTILRATWADRWASATGGEIDQRQSETRGSLKGQRSSWRSKLPFEAHFYDQVQVNTVD